MISNLADSWKFSNRVKEEIQNYVRSHDYFDKFLSFKEKKVLNQEGLKIKQSYQNCYYELMSIWKENYPEKFDRQYILPTNQEFNEMIEDMVNNYLDQLPHNEEGWNLLLDLYNGAHYDVKQQENNDLSSFRTDTRLVLKKEFSEEFHSELQSYLNENNIPQLEDLDEKYYKTELWKSLLRAKSLQSEKYESLKAQFVL